MPSQATIQTQLAQRHAFLAAAGVSDYHHCPNCGSTDLELQPNGITRCHVCGSGYSRATELAPSPKQIAAVAAAIRATWTGATGAMKGPRFDKPTTTFRRPAKRNGA